MMLKPRQIERVVKGFANHRRVQIMMLLEKEPELSVQDISHKLKTNYKTISEHLQKLERTGIIFKRNRNIDVLHKLSPKGTNILEFLRIPEQNLWSLLKVYYY